MLVAFLGIKYYRSRRPWDRYPLYLIMLFLAYLIFMATNFFFKYLQFSLDNLSKSGPITVSSLAMIETSIFVIVATFGTVVSQLVAATYSMRVVYVYRSLKDHLIILFIYVFILIYNIYLLLLIPNDDSSSFYDKFIWLSIFSGIYAILVLIVYAWNIFELLDPSSVILNLSEAITAKTLIESNCSEKMI